MSKQVLPKVTIIIPAYKAANYLRYAINSAISQTYSNTEIIVVNDGSPDHGETERIALSYGDKIRYFEKNNGGVATALNLAIEKMTGQLISWLSHDDMYEPDKVEKEVKCYLECDNPETIVFCGYKVIDEYGHTRKECHLPSKLASNVNCLLAIDTDYTLNGCAMLIPKAVFEKYGTFNPDLLYTQDYDLWSRFASNVPFVYLDDTLMLSRSHGEQGGRLDPGKATIESDNLHERLIAKLTFKELEDYSDGSIHSLRKYVDIYRNAGYSKTANILNERIQQYAYGDVYENIERLGIAKEWCRNLKTPDAIRKTGKQTIVFCNTCWLMGGVERVLTILLPQLNKKYQMIMVSIDGDPNKGYPLPDDIMFVSIASANKRSLESRLVDFMKAYNASVFVGHANVNDPFFPAYKLMKLHGIRTVMLNHYNYLLPYWINECISVESNRHAAIEFADVVLWLESFSAVLGASVKKPNGVMPNPIVLNKNCTVASHPMSSEIVCVGRFYDLNKRVDRMLEVFSHIVKKMPDAKLTLVGGYNWDLRLPAHDNMTLKEYYNSLKLPEGSVTFTGQQLDVTAYYKKARVLLMTSVLEGFGMVLCEAARQGVPAVVYDFPGLEAVVDGQTGFIVEQDDAQGAADRIISLLTDYVLWQRMSEAARKHCESYDVVRVCDKWEGLIDGLLKDETPEKIMYQIGIAARETPELFKRIMVEEKKALRHVSELASGRKILF